MRISTTTLEAFRLFRAGRKPEAELLATITRTFVPTYRVRLGRAYGRILEQPDVHRVSGGYACGEFRFEADAVDPALATIDRRSAGFEVPHARRYGAHTVVAKVDHIRGAEITEFKTRVGGGYHPDRYASSVQWRFELDVFRAVSVTYRIFHLTAGLALSAIEELPLYPSPALEANCFALGDAFVHYVRRRGLEAHLPDRDDFHALTRPPLDEPAFEDTPTRPGRRRTPPRMALPGEQRTPGTRRYWASGAEWAEHARELAERRGTRSKASRDAQAHLAALSPTFLAQQGREDLEAIRAVLLDPRTSSVPPCGQRAGTEYERIINAVNNALAHLNGGDADPVLCAPTRLAELAPTVELAPPTLKLQSPPFPTLRQASLF